MTNQIVPFQFDDVQVRVATDAAGEPLFVAKDVVEALDYVWKGVSGTMSHVPSEWTGVCSVQTPSGAQQMAVLTEQGLYFFLGRSDKPKALPFQKWLAGEVVPSIRRTGSYQVQPPAPQIPLIELQERKVALAERVLGIARQVGDDVLEVMAVDSIKNALANALPAPGSTGVFQTYEVLEALGFSPKQIRSIAPQAGKILKASFKVQTGEAPREAIRLVDGARRSVKAYPMGWFDTAKAILSEHFDVEAA